MNECRRGRQRLHWLPGAGSLPRVAPACLLGVLAALLSSLLTSCAATSKTSGRDESSIKRSQELVQTALQADKPERAIELYTEALAADPTNVYARNNLGVAYLESNRYYDAAREFDRAIKQAPDAPQPYFNLGLLYESVGKFSQAAENYQSALDILPNHPRYLVALVRVNLRQGGRGHETRALIQRALAMDLDAATVAWLQDADRKLDAKDQEGQ